MKPVSAEKMAKIDEKARTDYGISQEYLMERAGSSVADTILKDVPAEKIENIFVLCGKGNNGGDGFVAARHLFGKLSRKIRIYIPDSRQIKVGAALENFKKAAALGIRTDVISSVLRDLSASPSGLVIVDALLGTGSIGAMEGEYGYIADKINSLGVKVYSVDIPSGLDATTGKIQGKCFRAFKTITFGLPKTGFYLLSGPEFCGDIEVVDIGFPKELLRDFL